ncbi:hypothetical protein [Aridibaculum aurantiacum]|uniref:hypothetical protein n=1 Tax=Aridibaculum aurantiacum TaxID=2810307 RepID=UPI001A96CE05|nr:hypothetical protein [Aridibaculum aurantiacum]
MKNLFYLLIFTLVFSSCSKENSDSFFPYPNNPVNDTAWVQHVPANNQAAQLMESLRTAPATSSFTGNNGAVLSFADLQVRIAPNSLRTSAGAAPTGPINIELIDLRKKGDMIRWSRPTTSYGKLLETGGAFHIRATSNGQELRLAQNTFFRIKYNTTSPNQRMSIFYGIENPTGNLPAGTNPTFTWTPATDSSFVSVFQQQDSTGGIVRGYELWSQRLNWVNADYFIDTTQTRTQLNVLFPINYTNTNTNVFAVFKNENIVVQLNADYATRSFFTVNMPVGRQVTIVSLSKFGNTIFLGTKEITTAANMPVSMQPVERTMQQVEQYLQNL